MNKYLPWNFPDFNSSNSRSDLGIDFSSDAKSFGLEEGPWDAALEGFGKESRHNRKLFSLLRGFRHGQKRLDWYLEHQVFALYDLSDT